MVRIGSWLGRRSGGSGGRRAPGHEAGRYGATGLGAEAVVATALEAGCAAGACEVVASGPYGAHGRTLCLTPLAPSGSCACESQLGALGAPRGAPSTGAR